MSRDGYEHWDEEPEAPDPTAHDSRQGRRARRAARRDEQWLPDAQPPDRSARQGSHRRSGQYPDATDTDSGYASPGYADAGYGASGYPDGRYGDTGFGDTGYGDAGYGDAGRAQPGYQGAAYGEPGYREPGYPDARYGDAGYPGPGPAASRRADDYGQADEYGRPDGYPQAGGYGQADGYREAGGYGRSAGYPDAGYPDGGQPTDRHSGPGYFDAGSSGPRTSPSGQSGIGGADYQNGYRDAAYPPSGYPGSGYGPAGPPRGAAQDPFAPNAPVPPAAPFPAQDDPDPYLRGSAGPADPRGQTDPFGRNSRAAGLYGGSGGYGEPGSHDGQDPYGGPAGYDTADTFAGPGARGPRGAGPAGYDGQGGFGGPAGTQYGGGYDDHTYGAAAGPDPRERHPGPEAEYFRGGDQHDRYDRQVPVDDSGVTRRRERDPEDELDPDSARHNGFFRGFGAAEDEFGHRPPRRRRSRAGMVALVVLVLFVGGIVGAGVYGYSWYSKRHADWTGSAGHGTVLVTVASGAVACGPLENTLVSDGVVASASAFCSAAKTSGQSALLQPGEFRLHKHMGAAKAWALIISPKARVQMTVAVPDGMRASKVIALMAAKTGIPLSQFQSALKNTAALGLPSWAKGNPEGFLWPATYNFQPGTSALAMLQTMVKQFNTEIAGLNLAARAKAGHFTEYEVIITASLLEAEVPPQYYTKVARVIDNRLNQVPPWDLGLDSTVAYVVNKYIYNLSQSDLNVNSPYNTTKFPGVPPGPIDSPDVAAIQAVLHPAEGGWLYFVTINKQGTTLFTSSSAQFDTWAQEAKRNGV